MSEQTPYLLVAAACTASLLAWGYVAQRSFHGCHPVYTREQGPPVIPTGTVGLMLLCLSLFLSGPVLELLSTWFALPERPQATPTLRDVQFNLLFDLGLAAVLVGSIVGMGGQLPAAGFRTDRPASRLWDAVLGFHLAIGPVYLVLIASEVLGLRGDEAEHEMLRMLSADGSVANWIWISLTAVIGAPLAEELVFRVLFQGWLERYVPAALAILTSTMLFCVVHRFPDSLALIPLALVLGYIQHRRQSYLTVVAIHAAFNAFNLLLSAVASRPA